MRVGETGVLPCVLFPCWYGKGDLEWHKGLKCSRWRRTAVQNPIRRKQLSQSSEMYGMIPKSLCSAVIEKSHAQHNFSQNKKDKRCPKSGVENQLIAASCQEKHVQGFHRHCNSFQKLSKHANTHTHVHTQMCTRAHTHTHTSAWRFT